MVMVHWKLHCTTHGSGLGHGSLDITCVGHGSGLDLIFQGNNDDLILSCCLHYCKDKARDFMPKDKGSLNMSLISLCI